MDRRSWLRSIAAFAGLTSVVVLVQRYLTPQTSRAAQTVDLGPADIVIADGSRRVVSVDGRSVLLHRSANAVTALDLTCTHAGCPLAFDATAQRIRCACHGGAFALTGEPVAGPPRMPLGRLDCRIEAGRIYLRMTSGNAA